MHLAGQAQNLLRPKHKICFSLVLALIFEEHLRKAHEEVSNPKSRARLLHCKHPIGPGASHGAMREYGKAVHQLTTNLFTNETGTKWKAL